jgi:hypothetical protein
MNWNNGTLQTPHLRIQVTNSHIHAKGIWVMHVREFNWNTEQIGVPNEATEEEAQIAAVELVRQYLNDMLTSLNGL